LRNHLLWIELLELEINQLFDCIIKKDWKAFVVVKKSTWVFRFSTIAKAIRNSCKLKFLQIRILMTKKLMPFCIKIQYIYKCISNLSKAND
jgi:hypothetical protein